MRKGVQQNLNLTSSIFLPIAIEMLFSSGTILFFCGPLYFFNMFFSIWAYYLITKKISSQRKFFMQRQKEVDKKSDLALSESLQNNFVVQTYNSRSLELSKYTQLIRNRIEANSNSQKCLVRLNLMQRLAILSGTLSNVLLCLHGIY